MTFSRQERHKARAAAAAQRAAFDRRARASIPRDMTAEIAARARDQAAAHEIVAEVVRPAMERLEAERDHYRTLFLERHGAIAAHLVAKSQAPANVDDVDRELYRAADVPQP